MNGLIQDIRYALRQLRKNPGFFSIAALTLAIAIGANTAIFSVVDAFLIRKPNVADPDRVTVISSMNLAQHGSDRSTVSAPDFLDWRAQATSFGGMAAASFDDFTISADNNPERFPGARVSDDFFNVMGVQPALGRTIAPQESDSVVVISDAVWKSKFGANADVLGRTIKVDGVARTVVGVMPRSFRSWEFLADLWVPLKFSTQESAQSSRNTRSLFVFGRLKPGISLQQANDEMSAIAARIASAHPDASKNWGASALTLQQYDLYDADVKSSLSFLMGTVGFVLLIACANVACLLLSRSAARTHEFLTRTVLGASPARLARQLLVECFCLSLASAGFGILFGMAGMGIIRRQLNWGAAAMAWAKEIAIEPNVLIFTVALATAAAIFFGLFPALQIARQQPARGMGARWSSAGRKQHRMQTLLVVSQLALSLILVVGAGLFVEGFIEEMHTKTGFNQQNLLTAAVALRGPAYDGSAQRQTTFFTTLLDNLRGNPQVDSAAVADSLPFNFPAQADFTVEAGTGKPEQKSSVGHILVGPGFFATLQIPLLEGREFLRSDDGQASPVVIVSRAFALKYFGNTDPIGHHLRVDRGSDASSEWSEIVGVVGDIDEFEGQQSRRPHIYEPFLAHPNPEMRVIIRTYRAPETFSGQLRSAVAAIDRDQALTSVRTMQRVISDSGGGDDLMSGLMSTFAFIALTMAAIGTYGVLSYAVSQRTREMGVRMAVGAQRRQLLQIVMRQGATISAVGVSLGLLVSLAIPKLMQSLFAGFGFHSTLVISAAPVAVMLIALAACYVPARRAAKVDPMVALRYE